MISDKTIAEVNAMLDKRTLERAEADWHLNKLRELADASERAFAFGIPHDVDQAEREAIRWAIAQIEGTGR